MENNPKYIIVHHTGGTEKNPREDTSHHTFEIVNEWHRQDPNVWLGKLSSLGYAIGYHYFIDKTGKTTQGRSHTDIGAHCKGHNTESIGICLAGNFDVTLPTQAQQDALQALLKKLLVLYPVSILPHRAFSQKSCYGSKLSDTWARDMVRPVDASICKAEKDEIVALKKEVDGYKSWFDWFVKRFS